MIGIVIVFLVVTVSSFVSEDDYPDIDFDALRSMHPKHQSTFEDLKRRFNALEQSKIFTAEEKSMILMRYLKTVKVKDRPESIAFLLRTGFPDNFVLAQLAEFIETQPQPAHVELMPAKHLAMYEHLIELGVDTLDAVDFVAMHFLDGSTANIETVKRYLRDSGHSFPETR